MEACCINSGTPVRPARSTRERATRNASALERLEGRTLLSVAGPVGEVGGLSGWEAIESDVAPAVSSQWADRHAVHGDEFSVVSTFSRSWLQKTFDAKAGQAISGWAFFGS